MKYLLTLIIALSFAMIGCTTTSSVGESLAASIAIKYATIKVIEDDEDRVAVANRILEITAEAQALVDSGSISLVDELVSRIRDKVMRDDMEISKRLLAQSLLDAVTLELEKRIQGGSLNPETVVLLSGILEDIESTARLYI